MPVRYDILPRYNLAIFAYSGQVTFAETIEIVAKADQDPLSHPNMRQLCDLTEVTGVERDFPALLKMQARIAENLLPPEGERLIVFLAPTPVSQTMAQMARKSWDVVQSVHVRVVSREDEALQLLGLPQVRLADLADLGA